MFKHIVTYCVRGITLLIAVVILAFSLLMASPIDPVQSYVGAGVAISPEQKENIAEYWGLNDPPVERFFTWANNVLHGDLGVSMTYQQEVKDVIGDKFTKSILLMLTAWVISGVLGLVIGLVMGANQNKWLDRALKGICYTLTAVPSFYLGILLVMIFAVYLAWFPIGLASPIGVLESDVTIMERIKHMVLPAICLSVVSMPSIALHTRSKLIDALESDYAQFARARGEKEYKIVLHQCFRNIILPATMLQFASFSELFGGSVLVEQVFSYPGLGNAAVAAGTNGDVPLLLGITLFSAVFVFIGNAIGDIIIHTADPRIRVRRRRNASNI
ncbi:ABC transporter permease [Bacillus massiliigorillae]|uniref:ABC transporter permease n=1 Tax=Bacillus massiliigorillae TaxID=1243664 RepID=UPI00039A8C95|nr:ABC transporter permease [Bacillus massiliigorillae]